MDKINITVIIPNYNNAHYLENAIRSILNQTFTDYEIIVVDDGSTDNSRDVVSVFGDKVRYIWQENKGLGDARNTGILASKAEFIGLLDADDEWRPDFLKKMMALAQSNPDAVAYYCSAQGMDADGNDLPQVFGRANSSSNLYQIILRANFIIPSTVVFRRKQIVDAKLFDSNLRSCEDWDLWLRLLPSFKIIGSREILVRYRLHGNSLSKNLVGMHNASRQVIEKHFGIDDGKPYAWTSDKLRAYGGLYRYQALTFIQQQDNWNAAADALRKAFEIDPALTSDIDLFYELSFGSQTPGYRETVHGLNLEQNVKLVTNMLGKVFDGQTVIAPLRRKAFGIANYVMGLVAYNTKNRNLSRKLFFNAITFTPKLLLVERIVFIMVKSYLNPSLLERLKRFINRGKYADITK